MLVSQEEILHVTGYERVSDAKKCLESQGVRVFVGRNGRIFTTTELFKQRETNKSKVTFDGE